MEILTQPKLSLVDPTGSAVSQSSGNARRRPPARDDNRTDPNRETLLGTGWRGYQPTGLGTSVARISQMISTPNGARSSILQEPTDLVTSARWVSGQDSSPGQPAPPDESRGEGGAAGRCWPPRFDIPWPARRNPDVERMRQHSLDWARSFGIVTTEEEVARLDAPRFDRLAAYAYPDARGSGADLVSDWMIWFFPFDDWFDGPLGENPAAVHAVIDPMIRYLFGDPSGLSVNVPALVRAFVDLCGRSSLGMSSSWRTRFAEDMAKYLFSYYLETFTRGTDSPPDLGHLIEIRRDSIGIRPSLDFGETAHGLELAFPIALSEPFHRMRTICADAIVVQNDAYSLFKDLDHGELNNQAVVLMRAHGLTLEQATHHVEQSHDNLIQEYLELESGARTQAERYGLPEQKVNVDRYLSGLRSWISGNDAWSRNTVRYTDHVTFTQMPSVP